MRFGIQTVYELLLRVCLLSTENHPYNKMYKASYIVNDFPYLQILHYFQSWETKSYELKESRHAFTNDCKAFVIKSKRHIIVKAQTQLWGVHFEIISHAKTNSSLL